MNSISKVAIKKLNDRLLTQNIIMQTLIDVILENGMITEKELESKIQNNLDTHKETLSFFETHDECPTCTQKISQDLKTKKVLSHCENLAVSWDRLKPSTTNNAQLVGMLTTTSCRTLSLRL